ncbi:DeoR family transcriptional regulator [Parendozoicomonas sp. Alg238-R29]|uniref:DeoR family transcriptional regulator n=1 Tax=Parendozoicomonas sp. Alg238-R29 TaxID=2993446 RepID=UPI00248EE7EF|nr:DeoR family transcriptional regulator [Parendozoicomonas sp. Alg238-R29]
MNSRQKNILNRVDHPGSANINNLAEQFDVSIGTARRDLRLPEKQPLLTIALKYINRGDVIMMDASPVMDSMKRTECGIAMT